MSFNSIPKKLAETRRFLEVDMWRIRADKLRTREFVWLTALRILVLAIRRFYEDGCALRATALTFYSLLSIVPVLALAFGVAKGFGLEKLLEVQILTKLESQPEMADKVLGFARNLLENTKGGAIAGAGVVVLFWTVVKVLGNIESAFNEIWGVKKARNLGRKLADYLSVILIAPVLLIIASSATVLLTTRITSMLQGLAFLGHAASGIIFLLKLLPYAVIWLLFTFIYVYMPNTKVGLKSALCGGIVAGSIYQLVQLIYIKFQIGVAGYGAIYGSFAALPLFLAWLQVSWLIVLFGAEISFAQQNVTAFEFEPDRLKLNHAFNRLVALLITHQCVKAFVNAQKAPTAEEISRALEVPIRLTRSVLSELREAKILSEVLVNDHDDIAYQPGCHIDDLTVTRVLGNLDRRGLDAVPIAESKDVEKLREVLRSFAEINEKSAANLRLREI
jgi:membrane protein